MSKKMTADELVEAAEGHGMSFSINPWGGRYALTAVTPLIREDGTLPSDEAQATFAEVRARWPEVEAAVRRQYRAERLLR